MKELEKIKNENLQTNVNNVIKKKVERNKTRQKRKQK